MVDEAKRQHRYKWQRVASPCQDIVVPMNATQLPKRGTALIVTSLPGKVENGAELRRDETRDEHPARTEKQRADRNTGTKDGNVPLLPPRYFHAVGEFYSRRVKPEEQRGWLNFLVAWSFEELPRLTIHPRVWETRVHGEGRVPR